MMHRRFPPLALVVAVLLALVLTVPSRAEAPPAYVSPYGIAFTVPPNLLTPDFQQPPRNDPREEGEISYSRWYQRASYAADSVSPAWGPVARRYPRPDVPAGVDPRVWKRERVLAAAARLIGYDYQHHHVPDFDPGPSWPWLRVKSGANGKGVDCSNFTSFCYNYGLGLKLPTAIGKQADVTRVDDIEAERLALEPSRPHAPAPYAALREALAPGDLLFIRNRANTRISHVVMWVGSLGTGSRAPLVIDSHGQGERDADGRIIPAGVWLRPFREGEWYHASFDHALRWIR